MEKMLDPVKETNYYVPGRSSTFTLSKKASKFVNKLKDVLNSSHASPSDSLPYGIWDWAKENRNYMKLLETLKIIPMTNEQIFNELQQGSPAERSLRPRPEGRESSIEEFKCKDILIRDFDTDLKTEIVWLHHHENYWKKSLASKFQIDQFMVNRIIKEFNDTRRRNALNKKTDSQDKKLLKPYHIEFIQQYVKGHSWKHFTLKILKTELINKFEDIQNVSERTIARALHNQLNMSYRRLEKLAPQTQMPTDIRKLFESAIIQTRLEERSIELIYVDEFTDAPRKHHYYGWGLRGKKRGLNVVNDSFSMSFIIAMSREKIYGWAGLDHTTNTESYKRFIYNLFKNRVTTNSIKLKDPVIVCDNCSIHKSQGFNSFIQDCQVRVVTIWPYWPSLNPVEKLILSIKKMLKTYTLQGK